MRRINCYFAVLRYERRLHGNIMEDCNEIYLNVLRLLLKLIFKHLIFCFGCNAEWLARIIIYSLDIISETMREYHNPVLVWQFYKHRHWMWTFRLCFLSLGLGIVFNGLDGYSWRKKKNWMSIHTTTFWKLVSHISK